MKYIYLLFSFITILHASDNQNPEAGKSRTNAEADYFTLRETFPTFDAANQDLITYLSEQQPAIGRYELNQPHMRAKFETALIDQGSSISIAEELTTIDQTIKKEDPQFFEVFNFWIQHGNYMYPKKWQAIFAPYSNHSPEVLINYAKTASYGGRPELATLILMATADKLITGEKMSIQIENRDIDIMLTQILCNKALLQATPIVTTQIKLDYWGNRYHTNVASALLCPSVANNGCRCVFNISESASHYALNHMITEETLDNIKWIARDTDQVDGMLALATDGSSDLEYQVVVCRDPDNSVACIIYKRLAPKPLAFEHSIEGADISIIFENGTHNFYLKSQDKIYTANAQTLYDTTAAGDTISLKEIESIPANSPFVTEYLNNNKNHTVLCQGLAKKIVEKFTTQVLHTSTYSDAYLTQLKTLYKDNLKIVQMACNQDTYVHNLLLQSITDRGTCYLARSSFKPDTRIYAFIDYLNNTEVTYSKGYLYAHALCVYYIYKYQWTLNLPTLQTSVGPVYKNIEPVFQTLLEQSLGIVPRTQSIMHRLYMKIKPYLPFLLLPATGLTLLQLGRGSLTARLMLTVGGGLTIAGGAGTFTDLYRSYRGGTLTAPELRAALYTIGAIPLLFGAGMLSLYALSKASPNN